MNLYAFYIWKYENKTRFATLHLLTHYTLYYDLARSGIFPSQIVSHNECGAMWNEYVKI